jgi:putative intracellular protease/amidase
VSNIKNIILVVLTEKWCDWEAGYAIAVANSFSDYKVKTVAIDDKPKISMGGINASVDYTIKGYDDFDSLAMVIMPGGLSWDDNDYCEIAEFVKKIMELHIPVAAICGATTFLCRNGLLDNVRHTGDSLELFQSQKGYNGEALYVPAQVVADNNVITANETAAVQFAYEIFKILKVDSEEEMAQWYDNFKNGAIR